VPQESTVQFASDKRPTATIPPESVPAPRWNSGRLADAGGALGPRQLHVWLLPQTPSEQQREPLTLGAEEAQRAAAFARPSDQRRYVAAHGFLRAVLARYTGLDARTLCFVGDATGKPTLVPTHAADALHFNLSHAGELALCGVAREQPLGVDIEVVRELADLRALSRSTFSALEQRQFDALDPALQPEAFFAAWTRKEAVIKAMGTGLSTEPSRIEVSIDPRNPPALVAIDGSGAAARAWSLWGARLVQGAWWATACAHTGMELSLWCLQPDHGTAHHPRMNVARRPGL
jgi:4'-phosphopantetheinyl transferase